MKLEDYVPYHDGLNDYYSAAFVFFLLKISILGNIEKKQF